MSKRAVLTKLLLAILADLGESAVEFRHLTSAIAGHYGSAYGRGGHAYVVELKRLEREREVKAKLRQLRQTKYLVARKVGSRLMLSLTPKGRAATLVYRLQQAKLQKDGWYTVVIFDIPVSHNWSRKQFRQLLKQGGFIQLQRSVWASRAEVYETVAEFVRQVKLASWVNVYRAKDFLHMPKGWLRAK